ncbi:MAG: universal stress protein [Massilia sp.]|jgi:nucleotide-binding universal stress UspA family protein|nr:universal stress protein [Massilia sp.]
MFKRILLPTDGSALSGAAVALAVDLARQWGSELVAVAVVQPALALPLSEAALTIDVAAETRQLLEDARRDVEAVAAAATAAGVRCATVTVSDQPIHKALLDVARDRQCDLILMASHGRHGLSRLIAGSQTQKVMAESIIPVLVLRPGAPAAEQDR